MTTPRDVSQSNPGLHELYVGWAMHHLTIINTFLTELEAFSNGSLMDMGLSVAEERRKLIMEDTAYRDAAARLMAGMPLIDMRHIGITQVGDDEPAAVPPKKTSYDKRTGRKRA